jgi:hypothetical protein
VRRTHDYKRHGRISLFAALELKTSQVMAQLKPRHRSLEFRQFLDLNETQVPAGLQVHIIVDNYGTHNPILGILSYSIALRLEGSVSSTRLTPSFCIGARPFIMH